MGAYIEEHITVIAPKTINLAHFFKIVQVLVLVIQNNQDTICPINVFKEALSNKRNISTFFTNEMGRDLNDPQVVAQTVAFLECN
jgi:hypothetical protein